MKIEHVLSCAILAIHCAAFLLCWSQGWSLSPIRWMTRLGMSAVCLVLLVSTLKGIGFGLQPRDVAALTVCLVFAAIAWLTSWPTLIWLVFMFQCLTSAAFVWFIFFFRLTRLF